MPTFDEMYSAGTALWDVGHAQPAFVELEAAGALRGAVLDVGCGTGENALYVASKRHSVFGVDSSHRAIAAAREKARARGMEQSAGFRVHDALELSALGRKWETVIDSGLFHVFDDAARARFVAGIAAVLAPTGCYHALCFSDAQPGDQGPRRVTEAELRDAFKDGWTVESLVATRFETLNHPGGAHAWRLSARRNA